MTTSPCVYATAGWGIHDDRWTAALRSLGFEPRIVRLGIDVKDGDELRDSVAGLSQGGVPVLAGPLDTVTNHLRGLPTRVVGLSWGFDIHQMDDRSWLGELDALVIDSLATAELVEQAGVQPAAITFLPWGVEVDSFTPTGPRADLTPFGIPSNARTLLSLRAHEPLYRVADIIDAFALVSETILDLHLIIGHTGSLTKQLQHQAQALGVSDRTHFIGTIAERELPPLLRACDVYISASEVDGTSVTLLQAMACGAPALVSDTPGNRAWVSEGRTGHLFATGDASDLAQVLERKLTGPGFEIRAMTAEARRLVTHEADWSANLPRLAQALTGA